MKIIYLSILLGLLSGCTPDNSEVLNETYKLNVLGSKVIVYEYTVNSSPDKTCVVVNFKAVRCFARPDLK